MLSKRYQNKGDTEENIFWVTMADLMLGLAIIFITMFVLAMTGFSQEHIQQQQVQQEVSEKLTSELQKAKINAEVDSMTGTLKISDVDLFELNSYVLSPKGKQLLDKLAPIYINSIFSDKDLAKNIQYIKIQGHTDSHMFAGVTSKDEQFIRNMDLSLKRANAVAEYIFKTKYNKQYTEDFRKIVVVEGKSFNEPIIENGKENYNKSRRVELKLQVKDWSAANLLGLKK